jgi:hypothetical protein
LTASPYTHDGLPCRIELARNLRNQHASGQQTQHVAFLFRGQCRSETRYQKNKPHPPELAAGNNTNTKFPNPHAARPAGFSLRRPAQKVMCIELT